MSTAAGSAWPVFPGVIRRRTRYVDLIMETRSKRAAVRVADGGDAAAEDGYGGALTDWRAPQQ